MIQKHTVLVGIICSVTGLVGWAPVAQSETVLTRARIQELRNQVDFIPEGESARVAQLSDQIIPGDALSTDQDSFAELRFNDGSLARLGELVLFRFQPNTRTFELDNGTMLLLIPPGQGVSRLRTPNATAGIRGSGLFIRHIDGEEPAEPTTIIGALTTSGIEVANVNQIDPDYDGGAEGHDGPLLGTESVELDAGQMAVVVGDRPPQLFTFDLEMFYQTSTLVDGLALSDEPSMWSESTNHETRTAFTEHSSDFESFIDTTSRSTDSNTEIELGRDGVDIETEAATEVVEVEIEAATETESEHARDPIALVREETRDGLQAQAGTLTTPFIDNPPFIYSAWQPNTTGQSFGQSAIATDSADTTDLLDGLSEAADLQFSQPFDGDQLLDPAGSDVLNPPQPIELIDPILVGPQPDPFFPVGPIPDNLELPTPVDPIDPIDVGPSIVEPPIEPPIEPPVVEPPVVEPPVVEPPVVEPPVVEPPIEPPVVAPPFGEPVEPPVNPPAEPVEPPVDPPANGPVETPPEDGLVEPPIDPPANGPADEPAAEVPVDEQPTTGGPDNNPDTIGPPDELPEPEVPISNPFEEVPDSGGADRLPEEGDVILGPLPD